MWVQVQLQTVGCYFLLIAMASNLLAMASAMASNLLAMASNLIIAMASTQKKQRYVRLCCSANHLSEDPSLAVLMAEN